MLSSFTVCQLFGTTVLKRKGCERLMYESNYQCVSYRSWVTHTLTHQTCTNGAWKGYLAPTMHCWHHSPSKARQQREQEPPAEKNNYHFYHLLQISIHWRYDLLQRQAISPGILPPFLLFLSSPLFSVTSLQGRVNVVTFVFSSRASQREDEDLLQVKPAFLFLFLSHPLPFAEIKAP